MHHYYFPSRRYLHESLVVSACACDCYTLLLLQGGNQASRARQVEWLRERIQAVPVRLVFESALELMGCTQIGTFKVRCVTLTSVLSSRC